MNAVEFDTVAAPSGSPAWRKALLAVSIGTVGVLVGIGASALADGSSDTASPAAVVEAQDQGQAAAIAEREQAFALPASVVGGHTGVIGLNPAAAERWLGVPAPAERPSLSGMSPDAAERWAGVQGSTESPSLSGMTPDAAERWAGVSAPAEHSNSSPMVAGERWLSGR